MTPCAAPSRRDVFMAAAGAAALSGCDSARGHPGRLTYLLRYNTWSILQKPFVHGLPPNLLDLRLFKCGSIDTDWRPQ